MLRHGNGAGAMIGRVADMSSEFHAYLFGGLIGILVGVYIGCVVFVGKGNSEAISHGFAQYHPVTGDFIWVDDYEAELADERAGQ